MADRFFLRTQVTDDIGMIEDDQAHHLTKVMRAKPGDLVTLFDGVGKVYSGTVKEVSKKSVAVFIESTKTFERPTPEISVAVALPKGDRQKFLVEKLVELGATRLTPLATERTVAVAKEKTVERLKKQVIEATKQCRRAFLMQIETPCNVEQLIAIHQDDTGTKWIADPYTEATFGSATEINDQTVTIAIGPEGGFTDKEIETLEAANWNRVRFSQNVLRIETAAIAAIAILRNSTE